MQNVHAHACASTRARLSCLEHSKVNRSDCRKRVCLPTAIHFPFSCPPWRSRLLSSWRGAGGRLPAGTDGAGPRSGPVWPVWHAWLHCPTAGGAHRLFLGGTPSLKCYFYDSNHRAVSSAPDPGSAMVGSEGPCRVQIDEIRSSGAAGSRAASGRYSPGGTAHASAQCMSSGDTDRSGLGPLGCPWSPEKSLLTPARIQHPWERVPEPVRERRRTSRGGTCRHLGSDLLRSQSVAGRGYLPGHGSGRPPALT